MKLTATSDSAMSASVGASRGIFQQEEIHFHSFGFEQEVLPARGWLSKRAQIPLPFSEFEIRGQAV